MKQINYLDLLPKMISFIEITAKRINLEEFLYKFNEYF